MADGNDTFEDFRQQLLGNDGNPEPPAGPEPPATPTPPAAGPEPPAVPDPPTPPAAEPEPPATPAAPPAPEFDYSQLNSITGGYVKDKESFDQILQRSRETATLQARIQELEGKDPFSSDLSRKIDEMIKEGTPMDQVQTFMRFQAMDVDKMHDDDVIRLQMELKEPGLSKEDIDVLLEDRKRSLVDEEGEPIKIEQVKYKREVLEARKFLNEKKVSSEPKGLSERKQANERQTQLLSQWHMIGKDHYNTIKIDGKLEIEGQEPIVYEQGLSPEAMETITQQTAEHLSSIGAEFTAENWAKGVEIMKALYVMNNYSEIIKNAMTKAATEARNRAQLEFTGVAPQPAAHGKGAQGTKTNAQKLEEFRQSEKFA